MDAGGNVTVTGTLDMDGSSRLKMTGDLTFTAGTLDLDTNDKNINIDGDVDITSGATWTKGSGTVTFDGNDQEYTDNNGSPSNIGDVVVD